MLSLKTSWLSVKNGWSPYEIIHSGRHVHQTMNKGLAGMAGIYMYLYASPSLIAGWYLYVFICQPFFDCRMVSICIYGSCCIVFVCRSSTAYPDVDINQQESIKFMSKQIDLDQYVQIKIVMAVQEHYMSHCNVKSQMNNPCQFINFWVTHKIDTIWLFNIAPGNGPQKYLFKIVIFHGYVSHNQMV